MLRQTERLGDYRAAVDRLAAMGLTYPCTCTRRDIALALAAPQEGVVAGPDGPVYPGTCRGRTDAPAEAVVRLDMRRAVAALGGTEAVAGLAWRETGHDPGERRLDPARLVAEVGDVVLARRDIGTSYHLAVVVDDAAQDISHVIRGADLENSTPVHRLLQALLGLPVPAWHHHRLIRDEHGRRLAKRDDARAIARYRADGASPAEVRRMVGLRDG